MEKIELKWRVTEDLLRTLGVPIVGKPQPATVQKWLIAHARKLFTEHDLAEELRIIRLNSETDDGPRFMLEMSALHYQVLLRGTRLTAETERALRVLVLGPSGYLDEAS